MAGMLMMAQGCIVQSVHPLYRSAADITYYPALEGRWVVEDGEVWEFAERRDDELKVRTYLVTITDDGNPVGVLKGRLVDIDGRRFMDLFPYDFEYTTSVREIQKAMEDIAEPYPHGFEFSADESGPGMWFNNALLFPTHTVMQVRRNGDVLEAAFIDLDWITKRAEAGALELDYETEDGLVLITASSDELRNFVRKYADDEEVFEFETLTRE